MITITKTSSGCLLEADSLEEFNEVYDTLLASLRMDGYSGIPHKDEEVVLLLQNPERGQQKEG